MGIKFDFDPEKITGIKVPKADRADALDEVASFVKEQILSNTGEGKTSVKGGRWVYGLKEPYKTKKGEESSADFANLELTGDMLDALEVNAKGKRVRIEITGSENQGKAEGHLTGIYGSGKQKPRPRQFMPYGDKNELSPDIVAGVRKILKRYEE